MQPPLRFDNLTGQINAANVVTLNGSSTFNLLGNNTLAGIVFNNIGGTGSPTVNSAPKCITIPWHKYSDHWIERCHHATSNNIGTTNTLAGRIDFGSFSNTISVDQIQFNGKDIAPLQSGLYIHGIVGTSVVSAKTGLGVLGMFGQQILHGPHQTVSQGMILIAASQPSRFSDYTFSAGTSLNLNAFGTVLGSLAGAGKVYNPGNIQGNNLSNTDVQAATLTVGFSNASPSPASLIAITMHSPTR